MILIPRCIVGVMVAALLTVGCASVPATRFYTLSVPAESSGMKDAPRLPPSSKPIFIKVMPVNVPERLARPQLVVRLPGSKQETQLSILEQDRWSSHFNYELRDAFTTSIAYQTGAISETRGIPTADQHNYRITIELSQFDAIVGEKVQARFGWTITRSADGRNTACYSVISEPVGEGIVGVVKGVQRVVSSVSADVSKNLTELEIGQETTCAIQY
ncbi:MAG: membrane integrity-associated transporter subunit PqiC [Nitrosomonas sp.]|nr:membrane integrity-associated transporter subunit PqiC [Nitrosomonas sp.]